MSLSDPTSKMSKSHQLERSRILITDSEKEIKAKISSAMTDSTPGITYNVAERPGISNLLSLLSIFDKHHRKPEQLAQEYRDTHPRIFKDVVSNSIVQGLDGFRSRYTELLNAKNDYLECIEAEGARKARENADKTMSLVRDVVGL